MNHEAKNKAGILALNLIAYTEEYAGLSAQYLIPFSGQNRAKAEEIAKCFNDKYGRWCQYDVIKADILESNSIQEAVYACKVTERLNYSYVKLHSFRYAFDIEMLRRVQEIIDLADIDNLEDKLSYFWASNLSP